MKSKDPEVRRACPFEGKENRFSILDQLA